MERIRDVSVVMCTYNGEKYVAEQLESILGQTYPVVEIIVCDDNSGDNTLEKILPYALLNPKINIQKNEVNLGYNKNFERGLTLAKGEIIAIGDQDDIWHPGKIATMMDNWNGGELLIYCDSVEFVDKLTGGERRTTLTKRISGNNPKMLSIFNTVSGHNVLINRELLKFALPFRDGVYYDWWLAIVAMCNGGIVHLPKVLVYQRMHGNNVTFRKQSLSKERNEEQKKLIDKQLKHFRDIPNMGAGDADFFNEFCRLWYEQGEGGGLLRLFLFQMKHSKDIFAYKSRSFPFFSYVKHSFRLSYNRQKRM